MSDLFSASVLYKWQSALPEKAKWARALGHLINGLFVALIDNYASIGFLVCSTASNTLISVKNTSKQLDFALKCVLNCVPN